MLGMMGNDKAKKNLAAIIIAGKSKPEMEKKPEGEDGTEESYSEGMEAAAEEMFKAFERKDAKAFVAAYKDLHYLCDEEFDAKGYGEEGEEPGEEDEESEGMEKEPRVKIKTY